MASAFSKTVQQPGPLSAHTKPLCKLGKRHSFPQTDTALLGGSRRSPPPRLRGFVEHGWTSAPQLGVLCSEPLHPGALVPHEGSNRISLALALPALHSDRHSLSWESWHQRLPSLFPSPLSVKTNNNRKCPPLRVPQYSQTEVYTMGRALGDPLQ